MACGACNKAKNQLQKAKQDVISNMAKNIAKAPEIAKKIANIPNKPIVKVPPAPIAPPAPPAPKIPQVTQPKLMTRAERIKMRALRIQSRNERIAARNASILAIQKAKEEQNKNAAKK